MIPRGDIIGKYTFVTLEDINLETTPIRCDPDLLPHERETHIYFGDGDDTAHIDTSQKVIIRKLLRYPYFTPAPEQGIVMRDGAIVAVRGTLPRNSVTITIRPRRRFDKI